MFDQVALTSVFTSLGISFVVYISLLFILFYTRQIKKKTSLLTIVNMVFVLFYLFGLVITLDTQINNLYLILIGIILLILIFKYNFINNLDSYIPSLSTKELIIIVNTIFIGAFLTISFFFVQDFGNLEKTNIHNTPINFYDDIRDNQFANYEGDFLIPLNSASRYYFGNKERITSKLLHIYNITDRAPFIYFIIIAFMKIFGWSFLNYQMFLAITSFVFIIPLYFISKLFVNTKTSILILLVAATSHFFIFTTTYGPNKMIPLFFILSGIFYTLLYLQKKSYKYTKFIALSTIMFSLAFLSHQYSIIYYISTIFILFINMKKEMIFVVFKYMVIIVMTIFLLGQFNKHVLPKQNTIYNNVILESSWSDAGSKINTDSSFHFKDLKVLYSFEYISNKYYNAIGYFIFNSKPEIIRLFNYHLITFVGTLGIPLSLILFVFISKKNLVKYKNLFIYILLSLLMPVLYNGFYIRMGLMWYAIAGVPLAYIFILAIAKEKLSNIQVIKIVLVQIISQFLITIYLIKPELILKINRIFLDYRYLPLLIILIVVVLVLLLWNIHLYLQDEI